jgi:hypothetical protein
LLASDKRNYAAAVADVLNRFGNVEFKDKLNGEKIHRLENVMTLSTKIHTFFDELNLWLEATVRLFLYPFQNRITLIDYT